MITTVRQLLAGLRVLIGLTVVVGLAYPLLMTGIGRAVFPHTSAGSPVVVNGKVVGSSLIGQAIDGPQWFHPRPSAAGDGYDGAASSGSNLGPTNPDLQASIEKRRAAVAKEDGVAPADVPADAVTASASGLDPHISPAYAAIQIDRVATARGLTVAQVQQLVTAHTQGRTLGFLGEPRVNVVTLNAALSAS
jgi:K+-transporting ATPase ATPase C chain